MGCATGTDRMAIIEQHVAEAENRIALLDTEMKREREIGDEDEQSLRSRFAKMRVELDGLTNDVQMLRGRLDEIEYQLKQEITAKGYKTEQVMEDLSSNANRIRKLEEYLNLEPVVKEPPAVPDAVREDQPVKELTEEQLYAEAKQTFDRQDLEGGPGRNLKS